MILLTENNAFQNIGKCLQKKCKADVQIDDFLQYCIGFIFYDEIYIIGIVPSDVIQDTSDVIDLLKNKYKSDGVRFEDAIKFEHLEDNSEKANKLIKNVSKILTEKHIDLFLKNQKKMTANEALNYLPNLSPKIIKLVKDATKVIREKNLNILEEYAEASNFSRDSGHYKILNNDPLIYEKIFKFADEWNDAMTLNLLTEIRWLSNRELAKINDKVFLSSVKRGRIDYHNRITQEEINTITKSVDLIIEKTGSLLGALRMPSIKDYIVEKSHGSPIDILKITYELRNKFTDVRNYISNYGKLGKPDTIGVLNEIANAVYDRIKNGPPYESKTILENIHTHTGGVGPFSLSIPTPDIQTMDRKKNLNLCVQAFFEVTEDMTEQYNYGYMKDLKSNCFE